VATVLCVGHAVQDFVFALPRLPDRGEKYRATALESVGGGPAATAAVAIARLGGRARLAARLGADATADAVVAELERYGVDCTLVRRFAGCHTSTSAVMVDARGERMVVNFLDARLPADGDWLPEVRAGDIDAVLADSRWPEGAALMLARARAAGVPAVLDADTPFARAGAQGAYEALLRAATHAAFSAAGLADLTGEVDPIKGLRRAAAECSGWCCVTAGAEGVFAVAAHEVVHHTAFDVPAVDTLGAGDVWHGAFALALAERREIAAAVRFAQAAAALKVQRFGGRAGAPLRVEVDRLLDSEATR
jgi:sulfofructose kinase